MSTRLVHRAVSGMLRCGRTPPLPSLQRSACLLHHTQNAHANSKCFFLDRSPCLSFSPRCLATKAKGAARQVPSEIEEEDDDLNDELSDFDDLLVSEENVGRQVVVGDADW